MKTHVLVLLTCLMVIAGPAWSQCASPSPNSGFNPGCSIPINDPSSPYYTPDNEIPSPPPRPIGEWIKTWGAIAEGDNSKGGVSVGKLSKKEAEDDAVKNCLAGGGGMSCKPVFAYRNQCVAYAEGKQGDEGFQNNVASTESIEHSIQLALKNCAARGLQNCKIIYSACTEQVFRRY